MALLPGDEKIKMLYKYRKPSEHTFTNIDLCQLKFSFPTELNDPFDCKIDVSFNGEQSDWKRWLDSQPYDSSKKAVVWEHLKRINFDGKQFSGTREQEETKSILVLALSEINDNVLMWSHYSKYHTGFCLGFNTSIEGNSLGIIFDKNDIVFKVSDITPGFLPVRKVIYQVDMPPSFNSLKDDVKELMNFTIIKHPDWAYEKERRIALAPAQIKQQMVNYEKDVLKEVIIGYKTKKEDIDRLLRILKSNYPNSGKDIELKRAVPVEGKYLLKIEAI